MNAYDIYRFTEVAAKLDAAVPLQRAYLRYMDEVARRGLRYSNEDFDVRSTATSVIGKSDVAPWQAGFVRVWAAR